MALRIGALDLLATPPLLLSANYYTWGAGENAGPHFNESVLVNVFHAGRGRVRIGTQEFACQPGQVLHAPWASAMTYESDRGEAMAMTSVHLAFRPWSEPTPPTLGVARRADPQRRCMTDRPGLQPWDEAFAVRDRGDLRHLARRIVDAWSARRRRHLLLRGLAAEFVDALAAARGGDTPQEAHPHAPAMRGLATWMETQISQRVTRADLVARSGMDATTLTEAFRSVLGRSPVDWLIEARLREARALLRTTREPIAEVGRRVGIPDPFYFSKLFKRRVGVSPQRYRAGEG